MTEEPRWLDDQEQRLWRAFVEASGRVHGQLNESLKEHASMTLDDFEVLVHLSEAEGHRVRMTELSNRLLHSQSRLTQRVDRLAAKGFVYREKSPDDGRGTYACISDEGMSALAAAAAQHLGDVRKVLIDLIREDEQGVMIDVLERVASKARKNPLNG